jgi:hypothetical protein
VDILLIWPSECYRSALYTDVVIRRGRCQYGAADKIGQPPGGRKAEASVLSDWTAECLGGIHV